LCACSEEWLAGLDGRLDGTGPHSERLGRLSCLWAPHQQANNDEKNANRLRMVYSILLAEVQQREHGAKNFQAS
jgi:hypothetical protein